MSELTVIKIELNNHGKPIASIQGTTSYYGISPNDTFYPQEEADKFIAELKAQKDAKILAIDAEVFKQKHHAKLFFDERNYAETQLRRYKYKRCLAMVQVLEHVCPMTNRKAKWRDKWHKRWLEIAEIFKEAK